MKEIQVTCYNCGTEMQFQDRLTNNATCEKCASYLRCCLSCRFYDPASYNQCKEPQAQRVKDKDKANFCEFFEVSSESAFKKDSRKEEALKKLNDLFKPKSD